MMRKTIVMTALLLAPLPVAAQTVSNATGSVGFDANAQIARDIRARDVRTDSWAGMPSALNVNVRAVATGPNGGTVTTAGGSSASWAANGLSGTIATNAGWDFAARLGEEGVGANFGNGTNWTYSFTLDRAAALSFNYAVTADGPTFGLQGWSFVINGASTNLAAGNKIVDPRGAGLLTFALMANTPYALELNTNGNISSQSLSGYAARQDGDFRFAITAAGVPEPASWALMIGGFGLAGWALRRRGIARPATA